jgi:hypothetical protein
MTRQLTGPPDTEADDEHDHICASCSETWRCRLVDCQLPEISPCLNYFKRVGAGYF